MPRRNRARSAISERYPACHPTAESWIGRGLLFAVGPSAPGWLFGREEDRNGGGDQEQRHEQEHDLHGSTGAPPPTGGPPPAQRSTRPSKSRSILSEEATPSWLGGTRSRSKPCRGPCAVLEQTCRPMISDAQPHQAPARAEYQKEDAFQNGRGDHQRTTPSIPRLPAV